MLYEIDEMVGQVLGLQVAWNPSGTVLQKHTRSK